MVLAQHVISVYMKINNNCLKLKSSYDSPIRKCIMNIKKVKIIQQFILGGSHTSFTTNWKPS